MISPEDFDPLGLILLILQPAQEVFSTRDQLSLIRMCVAKISIDNTSYIDDNNIISSQRHSELFEISAVGGRDLFNSHGNIVKHF